MLRRLKHVLLAPKLDRFVLVHYAVVHKMEEAVATCRGQPESGGILLGSIRGPHLEITGFTNPGSADQRSMSYFIRQDRSHQVAVNHALEISSNRVSFIGEWHTHPFGQPIPSMADKSSWAGLVTKSNHAMCFLLASPQGWRGFWFSRRRVGYSLSELVEYERGDLGIVFR